VGNCFAPPPKPIFQRGPASQTGIGNNALPGWGIVLLLHQSLNFRGDLHHRQEWGTMLFLGGELFYSSTKALISEGTCVEDRNGEQCSSWVGTFLFLS